MDVGSGLANAGVSVLELRPDSWTLQAGDSGDVETFHVHTSSRLPRGQEPVPGGATPRLWVCAQTQNRAAVTRVVEAGWSVLTPTWIHIQFPGTTVHWPPPLSQQPPPQPWSPKFAAVIHQLLLHAWHRWDAPQAVVAAKSAVTQAYVSSVLARTSQLREPDEHALMTLTSMWRDHQPRHRVRTCWTAPGTVKRWLDDLAATHPDTTSWMVTADVAADILAPWRAPTILHILTDNINFSHLPWTPAPHPGAANIIVDVTNDQTVFSNATHHRWGSLNVSVADRLQTWLDLHTDPQSDRHEARAHVLHTLRTCFTDTQGTPR